MKDNGEIVLGIELSSRQGSVALLQNGESLAEKSWIAERVRHNTIFQTLEDLIEEAGLSYSDISLFAVGRGPGSFSGMRMSFAIAQALALPSKAEVRAVSSGAALALQVARAEMGRQECLPHSGADIPVCSNAGDFSRQIAVVGDARRGQVWIGCFQPLENGHIEVSNDWKLVPYDAVSISKGTVVVSPEAERLTKVFPTLGKSRFPHAKEVAELARFGSEELEPLYMHPPVFVEPKYA